jgi:isopentenyldiphosphate isomerase
MWDSSCAGHVEAVQTYEGTVAREFEEELGVALESAPEYLFKMAPTAGNGMEFAAVYRTIHAGPFTFAEDEIDELQWFSVAVLDDWVERVAGDANTDLTTGFCEIWRRYRDGHPR